MAEQSAVGRKVSRRFVAGLTVEDLIVAAVAMNRAGVRVTVDNLGENVSNREQVLQSKALYHRLLDEIAARKLDANVSLKLTHLGLDLDERLARETLEELLEHAIAIDSFIRVDMEGSRYTQKTLDIVRELHRRPKAAGHVGTVLQAYLYRTEEDARLLCAGGNSDSPVQRGVQGACVDCLSAQAGCGCELRQVAKQILRSGVFHGLATHDEAIIRTIQGWALKEGVPKTAFEFQMLHGVRRDLQEQLAREGWGVRCYIPFGTEWYPYFMRRLAERPANVVFLMKNFFKG